MARWDIDVYGVGRYGPGVPVPFLPDITSGASLPGGPLGVRAFAVDRDQIRVTWHLPPQAVFTMQRLVRSMVGPPAWEDDGEVLIDANMGFAVEWLDDGLMSARRYYYAVYVFDAEVQKWIRGGWSDATVPDRSFDLGDRMWRLIPPYFRDRDANGQLQRFCSLLGFELDVLRTEIGSLPDVYDMGIGNAIAVPLLLRQFGLKPEPELGYGNQRALLRNLTMLLGSKGSAECLRVLAGSVTGWAAQVEDGTNLLADNLDTQQDGGLGRWAAAGTNTTLAYRVGDSSINAPYGLGMLQLTAKGTGSISASVGFGNAWTLAPVKAGSIYSASMYARGIARATTVQFDWYDLHGTYMGSRLGSPVTPNIAAWNTRAEITSTVPANAWWLGLSIKTTGVVVGDVMFAHGAMIAQVGSSSSLAPPYQPARDARITVLAERINEVRNPRFAGGTAWWGIGVSDEVTDGGGVLSAGTGDTPPPLDEAVYGQLVTTAAGQGVWTFCPNLVPGALYSGSLWVKRTAGTGRVRLALHDDDDGSSSLSDWAAFADWAELSASLVSSDGAPAFQVSLVCDGPCTVRLGAGLLVRGDNSVPYFDGTIATSTADYMWEGPPDGSRSDFYKNRTTRSYRFRKLLPRFLPKQRTATLLFAQPDGNEGALYPGLDIFPGYDTFPGGLSLDAVFPDVLAFPSFDAYPQE